MRIVEKVNFGVPVTIGIALVAGGLLMSMAEITMPFTVGVLIDGYHLSVKQSGIYVSIETAGLALTTFLLSPFMGKVSRRNLALTGAVIAGAGQFMTADAVGLTLIGISRFLAGAGQGLMFAAVLSTVAGTDEPERVYASITLATGLIGAGVMMALPRVSSAFSYPAYFVACGLICVAFFPALHWLPKLPETGSYENEHQDPITISTFILIVPAGIFLWLGQALIWFFAERIGVAVGVTSEQVGVVLGMASLIGLAGSLLAAWLGRRIGRVLPLIVSNIGFGLSCIGVAYASGPAAYAAALLLGGLTFFFNLPYSMGVSAALDTSGRVSTVFGAIAPLIAIIAPILGAFLVSTFSYRALGLVSCASILISCLLIVPIAVRLDRKTERVASAETSPSEESGLT